MTKRFSTPPGAVLVAIDMSKHRQEVLIERPEGGRRRRMTVLATKSDYDRLAAELSAIGRPILVGFEATGNYHRTLAYRLLTAGFELRLISSVALARTREALHNGWDKNDPKDAQVILHMLRISATQAYVDPLGGGGAAGAATGLALGLGALTIPGVGPIIATGWFLSGAVTGALAGGVLGALVDAGVPASDAERHASEHASGRSVVSVRVEEPDVALATRIMDAAMPVEAGEAPQADLAKVVS